MKFIVTVFKCLFCIINAFIIGIDTFRFKKKLNWLRKKSEVREQQKVTFVLNLNHQKIFSKERRDKVVSLISISSTNPIVTSKSQSVVSRFET